MPYVHHFHFSLVFMPLHLLHCLMFDDVRESFNQETRAIGAVLVDDVAEYYLGVKMLVDYFDADEKRLDGWCSWGCVLKS